MIKIETLQSSVDIGDLQLTVTRDTPVWVTPEQVKSSLCIPVLIRLGKIQTSKASRSRVEKIPAVVKDRKSKINPPKLPEGSGQNLLPSAPAPLKSLKSPPVVRKEVSDPARRGGRKPRESSTPERVEGLSTQEKTDPQSE